jgi:hypothetical protein
MIEFFATIINTNEDMLRSMPHCGALHANGSVTKAPIYGKKYSYCNSPECKVRSGEEDSYHWYCPTQEEITAGRSRGDRNYCECEKNTDKINGKGDMIQHYFDEDDMYNGGIICSYCHSFCEDMEDE